MKALILLLMVCMLTAPASIYIVAEETNLLADNSADVARIDDEAPRSTMTTSDKIIITNTFSAALLEWRGVDEPGGSGVAYFDIQMMYVPLYDSDIDFRAAVMPWWGDYLMNTTETCDSFHPNSNGIYYFRCRAVDRAGNVEEWPVYFDTFIIGLGWYEIARGSEIPDTYDDHINVLERAIEILEYIRGQIVEVPENPDGVLDRTIYRLKQLDEAKDDLESELLKFKENMLPVADAGEDISENIVYNPFKDNPVEDIKDDVYEVIYEHQRQTLIAPGPEIPSELGVVDKIEDMSNMEFPRVQFDGSASYDPDGEIVHYFWQFGDGTAGYGAKISHRYIYPGDYNVTLTVVDDSGGYDSDNIICSIGYVSF